MRLFSMLRVGLSTALFAAPLAGCGAPLEATGELSQPLTVYQVGPGKPYANLQAVASLLRPGDVVEVQGGTTYAGGVRLTQSGTATNRITIRGVRVSGARPRLSGGTNTIEFAANHIVFEGFDVTGGSSRCVFHHGHAITVRDSVIHDCPSHGILGADSGSGSLTLEYSEIYRCGSGDRLHQIYMATDQFAYPGAVFRMQYNYVHDGNGGNNVKSRAERNEIYYNWIEGAYYHDLELIGPDGTDGGRREDSDVVGNVVYQGYTTRSHPAIRIGGDGTGQTFGRYRFLNNTIVLGNATSAPAFRIFDGIDSVEMHNNVLYRQGGGAVTVYTDGDAEWVNGRSITGKNNWVTSGSTAIPSTWAGTLTGSNPGFTDVAGRTLRPASTSALRDAGTSSPTSASGRAFPSPLAAATFEPPVHVLPAPGTAVSRVNVGSVDIGAYEYGNTGTAGTPPPPTVPTTNPPPPPPDTTATRLIPIEDAYVRDGTYATANYGTSTFLHVKSDTTASYTRDTYLKFDLGALATVSSATFRVYGRLTAADIVRATLYPVSGVWSESTLLWNTRPGYVAANPLGSLTATSTAFAWFEIDATSYVRSERQAGRRIVSFALHATAPSVERLDLSSREASANRPELVVKP
jgi:hypothetical protein